MEKQVTIFDLLLEQQKEEKDVFKEAIENFEGDIEDCHLGEFNWATGEYDTAGAIEVELVSGRKKYTRLTRAEILAISFIYERVLGTYDDLNERFEQEIGFKLRHDIISKIVTGQQVTEVTKDTLFAKLGYPYKNDYQAYIAKKISREELANRVEKKKAIEKEREEKKDSK